MIIVLGQPRCGTSMMMNCLHKAGIPLAFDNKKDDREKKFRNPYGMYEGQWNGNDGLIKLIGTHKLEQFKSPRIVFMTRDPKKINASWKEVTGKKDIKLGLKAKEVRDRFEEEIKDLDYIKVDYDTFVNTPDKYKEDFNRLFPELNFDTIKSGIDKDLYINR